jgi:hypothetical protein
MKIIRLINEKEYPPRIWRALDGFLAVFPPCPYIRGQRLRWYLAHFLELVLSEMGTIQNHK